MMGDRPRTDPIHSTFLFFVSIHLTFLFFVFNLVAFRLLCPGLFWDAWHWMVEAA